MKSFVFWQNMLSIHQSAFIRELAIENDVTLIVDQGIEEWRVQGGWTTPDFGRTKVIVADDKILIEAHLHSDSIHIFSGINAYKMVSIAFNLAVKRGLKIGVISEPFDLRGFVGKLRFMKYFLFRLRYEKKIDFVLAVGMNGRKCFEAIGFPLNKIYDWAYFTESPTTGATILEESRPAKPKLLFIGSIIDRKGIVEFIKAIAKIINRYECFTIIGRGDKEHELVNLSTDLNNIKYLGGLPNKEALQHFQKADLFILPSKWDGWGAVVNESLMAGVPVITTTGTGASILVDGTIRGAVFTWENGNVLEVLNRWLDKGQLSVELRNKIRNWASNSISGVAAKQYFLKIISYMENPGSSRPIAPWIRNN